MRKRIDRVNFAAAMAWKDLTVKRLSELSGVSRVTISSIRAGKSCSEDTAKKLAAVLGRDIIEESLQIKSQALKRARQEKSERAEKCITNKAREKGFSKIHWPCR